VEQISAHQWYETRKLGDDVTFISEPHIKEYYRCNIWHIRGRDRDLLVDTGMGVVSLRRHVPIVTEKPCLAVASHTHFDHIGCHHEFEERLIHADEADILAAPTRSNTNAGKYVGDDIFTALPPAPYSHAEYNVGAAPATGIVGDGDVIGLGDRHFEVVHTPGHSPGGIALWEAATGILFSGDIVYDGPLAESDDPVEQQQYYNSMKRLLKFPVRMVHGGHYPSYSGARHREIIKIWLREKDAAK